VTVLTVGYGLIGAAGEPLLNVVGEQGY